MTCVDVPPGERIPTDPPRSGSALGPVVQCHVGPQPVQGPAPAPGSDGSDARSLADLQKKTAER